MAQALWVCLPYVFAFTFGSHSTRFSLIRDCGLLINNVDFPQSLWLFLLCSQGHIETIFDCKFKPADPSLLATASFDGTIKVWDVNTLTAVHTSPGNEGIIYSLSWAPGEEGFIGVRAPVKWLSWLPLSLAWPSSHQCHLVPKACRGRLVMTYFFGSALGVFGTDSLHRHFDVGALIYDISTWKSHRKSGWLRLTWF